MHRKGFRPLVQRLSVRRRLLPRPLGLLALALALLAAAVPGAPVTAAGKAAGGEAGRAAGVSAGVSAGAQTGEQTDAQAEAAFQALRIQRAQTGVRAGRPLILQAEAQDATGRWQPVAVHWEAEGGTITPTGRSGRFLAAEPGDYRITAQLGDLTAAVAVTVWGDPDRLILAAPSHVEGDGLTRATVLAQVVDQRGAVVGDFAGKVRLTALPAARVWPAGESEPSYGNESVRAATAGQARFSLVLPGSMVDRTLTLRAWADLDQNGRFDMPGDAGAVQRVAVVEEIRPAIRVEPAAEFLPASGAPLPLFLTLVDADGEPLRVDGYAAEVSVTAPAHLEQRLVPLVDGRGQVTLWTETPGTVTVTARPVWSDALSGDRSEGGPTGEDGDPGESGDGRRGAGQAAESRVEAATSLQLTAQAPGPARSVRMFVPGGTETLSAGTDPWDGIQVGVQVVDAAGVPVSSPLDRTVRLGTPLLDEAARNADARPEATDDAEQPDEEEVGLSPGAVLLEGIPLGSEALDVPIVLPAGATTALVRVQAGAFTGELPLTARLDGVSPAVTAPGELTLSVQGGPPAAVVLRGVEMTGVFDDATYAAVEVAVLDRFGNLSPTDGVEVEMEAESNRYLQATISGDGEPGVAYTEEGVARFSVRLEGRVRRRVEVRITEAEYERIPLQVVADGAEAGITMMAAPPREIEAAVVFGSRPTRQRTAGDQVRIRVVARDPQTGQPVGDSATADALRLRYSSRAARPVGSLRFRYDPDQRAYFSTPIELRQAGRVTFTVTYTGGSGYQRAQATVQVAPDRAETIRLRGSSRSYLYLRNQTLGGPFYLEAVDAFGNPTPLTYTATIPFTVTGPEGGTLQVRTEPAGVPVDTLKVRAEAPFYLITTEPGTYTLRLQAPNGDELLLRVRSRDS